MLRMPAIQPVNDPPPFVIPRIGDLNIKYTESEIKDHQSPYLLNVVPDGVNGIAKRKGWAKVYATSLGAGAVHHYGDYRKLDGTTITLIHHGTKLYTQSGTDQPVEIHSGLANTKGVAFVFSDKWYYIDGVKFIQYDGTTVAEVTGYAPTVTLARLYDGGGTAYQDYNYLSNSFKDSFSPDGSHATFQLSQSGLSATEVLVTLGGTTLTEGEHFTVDRTAGTVDFSTGTDPHGNPVAGTNTLVIQAEKADLMDASVIIENKYLTVFGGRNDTRVFLTGNPDYPNTVYWCGADISGWGDPTYWPENNNNKVGSDAENCTGLAVQYDQLVILKERSIFRGEYEAADDIGEFYFFPLNSAIGCDMPGTVQLIENDVVFCNTYAGPQILTRTDIRTERNVRPLGGNIIGAPFRAGMLDEDKDNLLAATSIDWDGMYALCVGSKVWAWDYRLTPYANTGMPDQDEERLAWYYWENVNANCWLVRDNVCYFGDRTAGLVKRFRDNFNDDGAAINAVWRSKLFNFNAIDWLKNVMFVYFRTRETNNSQISIKYLNEDAEVLDSVTVTSDSFSWANFSWAAFSWAVSRFYPTKRLRPKMKKIAYFQLEFSNARVNENLSVMDLEIYYNLAKKVK